MKKLFRKLLAIIIIPPAIVGFLIGALIACIGLLISALGNLLQWNTSTAKYYFHEAFDPNYYGSDILKNYK